MAFNTNVNDLLTDAQSTYRKGALTTHEWRHTQKEKEG